MMDHDTFDALARSMSLAMPRRRAGRLLGGSVLGGLLTLQTTGLQEASAKKKHKRCIPNTPAFTTPTQFCRKSSQCCGKGSCCPFEEQGKKACVNLTNNASFCGETCATAENCINFDPDDPVCEAGLCVLPLS
ncbi:MAG: hypothetical protein U0031_12355 [Thermomicrobiales bacterium]